MRLLYILLSLLLMSYTNSERIPMAVPVENINANINANINEIKNIIYKLSNSLDYTNSALTGLNIFNIVSLQNSVNNLGSQITKLHGFNQNMDKLNNVVGDFNKMISPISILAHNKNVASEIESKIREKEFALIMAELRAKSEKISVWEAHLLNANEKSSNTNEIVIGSMVTVILCQSFYIFSKF
jgi:hypothetical protein